MVTELLIDMLPIFRLAGLACYRLLFFGQLVSFFGSMMTFIVVPWQMYELTQSSAMVGYIYLVEFVPMVTLAFIGGALADYFDKRFLLRSTEFGQGITSVILLVNSLLPNPQIWVLFVCVAIHAGLAALQRPAFESLIQKLIPPDLMSSVMALNSIRFTLGAIIGPAAAGILAVTIGPWLIYALDLVTFAGTIYAVYAIAAVPSPDDAERPSLAGIKRGWKIPFSRQELSGLFYRHRRDVFRMPQALTRTGDLFREKYVGFFLPHWRWCLLAS